MFSKFFAYFNGQNSNCQPLPPTSKGCHESMFTDEAQRLSFGENDDLYQSNSFAEASVASSDALATDLAWVTMSFAFMT